MKRLINLLFVSILLVLFLNIVTAYETYEISNEEFEAGYTNDLSPGDKITVNINEKSYHITTLSIYQNLVDVSVSENERQNLGYENDAWPSEMNFEVTYDDYYDIYVKIESINWTSSQEKSAKITVKKTNEEVPEGTDLPYSCYKVHTCSDGTEIVQCQIQGQGCLCKSISSLDCPEEEPEPCEKYYTCPDGTKVQYCFSSTTTQTDSNDTGTSSSTGSGGGCGCKDPIPLCPDQEENNESETDMPEVSMDKCLDNPENYWDQETNKCYSGYSKDRIKELCSDRDGKNFFKQTHTFGFRSYSTAEDPSKDLRIRTGGRDGCLDKNTLREHYCSPEGFIAFMSFECKFGCEEGKCLGIQEEIDVEEKPIKIPEETEETMIDYVCRGCELKGKCFPLGYRKSGNYCSENYKFTAQSEANLECENNFECESNLCIDDKCLSSNLWQKILGFFKKLFG